MTHKALRGVSRENIKTYILDTPQEIYKHIARKVANMVTTKRSVNENLVLALPTGSTPVGIYQELVRMHKEEGLDLSNVITFNLDEYYPIDHTALQSYHRFMNENFFDHVNIKSENIHIPNGELPRDKISEWCMNYEAKIKECGGLDLALLGIGRDGHIAFNEPGSRKDSRTRLVVLDEVTINDAAGSFFGKANVKTEAITMGVATIMSAKEVIIIATGENKYRVVQKAVEGPISSDVPATFLQEHPNAVFYIDKAASELLTRVRAPWTVNTTCKWDKALAKKAVLHLCEENKRTILELELKDFQSSYLHDLVDTYKGNTDNLARGVFNDINSKIVHGDIIANKKVLIFSPHPDDDVICMGGTMQKLFKAGCEITVAYMTNGSVSVHDYDVKRHVRFAQMCADELYGGVDTSLVGSNASEIFKLLDSKIPGTSDHETIQKLKGRIRYAEAISSIEVLGISASAARFLDLPFYKTGLVKKNPIGDDDVRIVLDLLKEVQPDHIFVAGDLTDPHGTHRMCYHAILRAMDILHDNKPMAEPNIWLYRGAWQEWPVEEIDVIVPLTKMEMDEKIQSIYKHQSQKDKAAFPGSDKREFWERARDRNTNTANQLKSLGLPAFYAVEAFVRCTKMPM